MREIRQSGSEGGGTEFNRFSLPLSPDDSRSPTAGETDARLEDLKTYLRARLPGNIAEFDRGETAKLCANVLTRLQQVIEAEVKRFEDRPALDLEVEAHNRFAEDRCRIFTGRERRLLTFSRPRLEAPDVERPKPQPPSRRRSGRYGFADRT